MNFSTYRGLLARAAILVTLASGAQARMMDYDLGSGDVFDDGGFGVGSGNRGPGNGLIAIFKNAQLVGTPTNVTFDVYFYNDGGTGFLPDGVTACCNSALGSTNITRSLLTSPPNSIPLFLTTLPCSVSSNGGTNVGDNVSFTCAIQGGVTTLQGTTNFLFASGGTGFTITQNATQRSAGFTVDLVSTNVTTAVPEPSTAALGLLGGAVLLARLRKRS